MNRLPCPECGKSFLNLRQHQTKIHKTNTICVSIPSDIRLRDFNLIKKQVWVNIRGDDETKHLELLDMTGDYDIERTLTYEDCWTGWSFRITLNANNEVIKHSLYRIYQFKEGDADWRPVFKKMYSLDFMK